MGETTCFDLLLFQMRKLRPKGKKCLVKKGHSTFKDQSQDRNLNFLVFHFTEIPVFNVVSKDNENKLMDNVLKK